MKKVIQAIRDDKRIAWAIGLILLAIAAGFRFLVVGGAFMENIGWIFIGTVIYLLGFLFLLYPDTMIYLTHFWLFSKLDIQPEFSDEYIVFQKIGGLICMGVGLFFTAGGEIWFC